MTAELELSGAPVNAFGKDVKNLVLEVEYQTEHRQYLSLVKHLCLRSDSP
jgi:hypothetical protein